MTFSVSGRPVGKARPRFNTRTGRTYKAQSDRDYERLVQMRFLDAGGESFEDAPIMASVTAYFPIPKGTSRAKANRMNGGYACKKPDADNIAKSVLDALNGFAYNDDKQIVCLTVQKLYDTNARVEITIEKLEE